MDCASCTCKFETSLAVIYSANNRKSFSDFRIKENNHRNPSQDKQLIRAFKRYLHDAQKNKRHTSRRLQTAVVNNIGDADGLRQKLENIDVSFEKVVYIYVIACRIVLVFK